MADPRNPRVQVLSEVALERRRQDAKWGVQNHPDGTGDKRRLLDDPSLPTFGTIAEACKAACARRADRGEITWTDILLEEVFEAAYEPDPDALRRELLQVAAVATAWVEALDRREGGTRG